MSGSSLAGQPESSSESANGTYEITYRSDASLVNGYSSIPLEDQIIMHLESCVQCRRAIATDRPRGMGQKSGHCETYWSLQLQVAGREGFVNNIVAYDEEGREAPKGRNLEP